jgi:hypothetical protein
VLLFKGGKYTEEEEEDWNIENPGRFAPMTCSPRIDSPRKVSRIAPLNRYYIIIDEIFFDNFFIIIYLLVVYKKKIIHSFWSTFVKDLKRNFSCKIYKNKGNNKITELRTILQRESQNS